MQVEKNTKMEWNIASNAEYSWFLILYQLNTAHPLSPYGLMRKPYLNKKIKIEIRIED